MPVGYGSSTSTGANDALVTSVSVPVPAGVVAGNHIYVALEQWEASNPTVTAPAGFVLVGQQVSGPEKLKVFVKEATGPDAGSYTFSWTGTQWTLGHAVRVTGAKAGNPTGTHFNGAASASGTAIPNTSVTVGFIPGLLQWSCNENAATQTTTPTGFTEVQDSNYLHSNHRMDAAAAGTYTAPSGVLSASTLIVAMLVAVEPAASGTTVTGTAAAVLGGLAAAASGVRRHAGAASALLGDLAATASGTTAVTGAAAAPLGALAASASGAVTVAATAAAALGALAAAATGDRIVGGTATTQFGALASAAIGTVTAAGGGIAAAPLGSLAASAAAAVTVTSAAAAGFGALAAQAFGNGTTASAAASIGTLTATAGGLPTVSAAAAAILGGLTAHAAGATFTTGTAVALLGALTVAADVPPPITFGAMDTRQRAGPTLTATGQQAPTLTAHARTGPTMTEVT